MDKNRKIDIMGIVNITDDSFYPGSRCAGVDEALDLVRCHMEGGASIVDVGACSSRPGSLPVGPDEEWKRLEPVLKSVRDAFPSVGISVDTYWSEVVDRTYDLIGDFIVNDISAGEDDPKLSRRSRQNWTSRNPIPSSFRFKDILICATPRLIPRQPGSTI